MSLGEQFLTAVWQLEKKLHPVQRALFQVFYSVLRLCLLFLSFARLFSFACILESMKWDEGELFPRRRASIVQNATETERWVGFLRKGEQGTHGEK